MRRIQRRLDRARLAPVNVARALALLLAVLVFASGCDDKSGQPQASTPNESEPISADATESANADRDAAGETVSATGPNLGAERVVVLAVDGLDGALLKAVEAEAVAAAVQATASADASDGAQAQTAEPNAEPLPAFPNLAGLAATTRIAVIPPAPATRHAVWTELQTGRAATKLGQLGAQRATAPVGTTRVLTGKLVNKADGGAGILHALMLAVIFALVGALISNHRLIERRLPKGPGPRAGVAIGLGVLGFVIGIVSSATRSELVQDYSATRPARAIWHDMAEAGVPVVVTNAPFSFPAIDDEPKRASEDEGDLSDEQKREREEARRQAEQRERTRLANLSLLSGVTVPDLHGPDRPQVFGENAPKNENNEVDTTRDIPVLRARYRAYVETIPDHLATLPSETQLDVVVRRTGHGGEIVSLTNGRVYADGQRTTFAIGGGEPTGATAAKPKARARNPRFLVPLIGPRNGDDDATFTSVPLAIERDGSRLNITVGATGMRSVGIGEWTPAIRYTVARKKMAPVLVQLWLCVASVEPIVVLQTPIQAVPSRLPADMALAHPAGLEASLAGRLGRSARALPAADADPFGDTSTYPTAGGLTRGFAAAFADGFPRALVRSAAERDMDALRRLTLAHLRHTPWRVAITQISTIADALPAFGAVDGNGRLRLKPGLLGTMRLLDALVGDVRALVPDAAIMVVGTHGIAPVKHVVNLNAWLKTNGYLTLRDDAPSLPDPARPLAGIDWAETRVVCLDGGRLLVNVTARQPAGTVQKSAIDTLLGEVIGKLTTDARMRIDGIPAIARVDRTNNEANGDAVLVFNRGFALSSVTPLGGGIDAPALEPAPPSQQVAFAGAWKDAPLGILLSNRSLVHDSGTQAGAVASQVRLVDIAATLLAHVGLDPAGRDGKPMRLRAPATSEEVSLGGALSPVVAAH